MKYEVDCVAVIDTDDNVMIVTEGMHDIEEIDTFISAVQHRIPFTITINIPEPAYKISLDVLPVDISATEKKAKK